MHRGVIIGTGSCLPERVLTNSDLEKMVDTSDEWITTRTGSKQRYIAGKGEETSKIAAQAARRALAMADVSPEEIGLIVVGTISSEMSMPSCACLVQKEIGANNAFAYDLNAACAGFTYCLDLADKYVRSNPELTVLVIGAETLSARTNWKDRNTCVLFGDGAGACVVSADNAGRGLLGSYLRSDGRYWDLLHMDAAPSMNPDINASHSEASFILMNGRDVFKHAVRAMTDAVDNVMTSVGVTSEQIDLVIPHQANIRILNSLIERLNLGREKFYINIENYGNTSAASIPIAIDEANRQGVLKRGDVLLLCTFGAGLAWGAALIKW